MLKIEDSIVTTHFDISPNGCILEFQYKNGWIIYYFNKQHKITDKEYYKFI